MKNYDDIINLSRPVSNKHKPMTMDNRAAQFAPFAALNGYAMAVEEAGRITLDKKELSEDMAELINNILNKLKINRLRVKITYFVADDKKSGGKYVVYRGYVKKIDMDKGVIVTEDNNIIFINDIAEIVYI